MLLACDTETTGLNPWKGARPFFISFYDGQQAKGFRVDVDPYTRSVDWKTHPKYEGLLNLFSSREITWIFHNATFDLTMLEFAGFKVAGKVVDTFIMAHLWNNKEGHGLKELSKKLLGISDDDEKHLQTSTITGRKHGAKMGYKTSRSVKEDYWLAAPHVLETYALLDAERTYKLYHKLNDLAHNPLGGAYKAFSSLMEVEHTSQEICREMALKGITVDMVKLESLEGYYTGIVNEATKELNEKHPGINFNSPKQKNSLFYDTYSMDVKLRTRKNNGKKEKTLTTDKNALKDWSKTNSTARTLLNMSAANKQLSAFVTPFKELACNGVLHPGIKSIGTTTGRMACSSPNLQNVTSEDSPGKVSTVEYGIREAFIARKGHFLISVDYSQVEVFAAAYISKEPVMISTLENGESLHDMTCSKLFGNRQDFNEKKASYRKAAKIVNFSMLYGTGVNALADLLNVSVSESRELFNAFWDCYPTMRQFSKNVSQQCLKTGYVMDAWGRAYKLDPGHEYKALNYIIQGFCAGILKRALIALNGALKPHKAYPLIPIHDEFIIEAPISELNNKSMFKAIQTAMSGNFHEMIGMPYPFKTEISVCPENWGHKKKYEFN